MGRRVGNVPHGWWNALLRPWDRLGVRVGAAILAAVALTAGVALLRVDHSVSENAEAQLVADVERAGRQARWELDQLTMFSALAAGAIASRPDVATALARGDIAAALATATSLRDRAGADRGQVGLTLYDARGAVLLRAHAPLNRDQRAAPASVLGAIESRTTAAGVRPDEVLGLAVFAAAPVIGADGRVVGIVETLTSLDDAFASRLAGLVGDPIAILPIDGAASSSEPGWTPPPGVTPTTDMRPHALQLAGRDHVATAFTLADADGRAVGALLTGSDRAQLMAERAGARRQVGIAVGIALAAGAALALVLNALTLRPLRELTRAARRIRGGDVLTPVPRSGPAELRAVGAALDDMRVGIHAAREQLLAANDELAARAEASAAGLTTATAELAVMHTIVAAIAREPDAGSRVAVDQLLHLEWVDGAFVALAGADGALIPHVEAALGAARAAQLVAALRSAVPTSELAGGVFFDDVAITPGDAAAPLRALAAADTHALAVVPLPTPEGIAGVLGVVRGRPVEFGEPRRFLLRAIGDELAGSIERAELADEASEHRRLAEAVLREMADGVVVLDSDGRCRICNPAATRLLRVDPARVLGVPAAAALPLPAETIDALRVRARDGTSAPPLLAVVHGRELALAAGPFGGDAPGASRGTILLLRDLTDVTAAERAKQDFVSMVGHELRTPLTLIRTSVDLLGEEAAGSLTPTQQRIAEVLRSNADRLQQLVSDLLDMSAIDSGRVQVHPVHMDLADLVRDTVEAYRSEAERERIVLESELPATAIEVWADRGRVRQVLQNLIHNAVKYTPAGGHVAVRLAARPEGARVDVTDDGIGIPPAEQGRLFEKFYRTRAGQRQSGGTGLGLAIARSLVELHHGQIWCESDGASGSTFSFTLPRQPTDDARGSS